MIFQKKPSHSRSILKKSVKLVFFDDFLSKKSEKQSYMVQ